MGVDTRRPVLPAPTESLVDTTGGSTTGTDLATDLSRRTDKTSYSIPDDGSPITVSTRRHRDRDDKLSRSHRDSQTSLLIEYFEGGKETGGVVSRPSVRVRVTPSGARKFKDKDRIQITESGSRKPSYTRRISLTSPGSKSKQVSESILDEQSLSESNSADEESPTASRRPPVEIELLNRDHGSELSTVSRDTRFVLPSSDISSMPADSMLDATSSAGPRRKRSQSLERGSSRDDKDLLKTPSRQRSRSLSKERIAHRVAEKLSGSPHEVSSGKHRHKHRSKSSRKDYLEAEPKLSRRKLQEDDIIPSAESSLLSTSAVSSNRKSGDQYSIRSGASKSSINNPKLLETVEDAIRRLILPELKELKKDQKVMKNTNKFERDRERDMMTNYSSTSSRDELGRRLSKHSSAPDIIKPRVLLTKDSKDEGIVLAESGPRSKDIPKTRKSSKSSETSDNAWVKWGRPELTEQDKLRRQKSKGLRDAQAAGRVGSALTAASLKHHDSQSSLGQSERRDSDSRKSVENFNVNETELVFKKHNVPRMPMHSEIDSELTRASLLSERTESPGPNQNIFHGEVLHGSPRQLASPASRTPTRTPLDAGHELGMRHGNQSQRDLSVHSASDRDLRAKSQSPGTDHGDWAIAAAAAANLLDAAHPTHEDRYEAGRALSPIQSVASDQTETHGQHQTQHHPGVEHEMEPRLSIDSLSSAPSTNLARSTRNGVSPHSQQGEYQHDQDGPELGYEQSRHASEEDLYGNDEESRRSLGYDDSEVDFMDRVKEGQHVAHGAAANPQFIHPVGVESAVASLMDPSVLESQSSGHSGNRSQTEFERAGSRSPEKRGSPLKQVQEAPSLDETSFPRRMGVTSPPQSVTQSIEELEEAGMAAAAARGLDSSFADAEARSQESESEINTNPSIIQGPIGGVAPVDQDHWGAAPVSYYDSPAAQAGGAKDLAQGQHRFDAEYHETARNIFGGDDYYVEQHDGQLFGTPPGAKDEGYVSAANPMSPSIGTPKQASRGLGADVAGVGAFDNSAEADDPFASNHQRHFSGYSHGVASPLYDSATGRGIERIQSKDIVALMDHLTVRDAQRNARDTEILVTLVRSAAEMRTSFEEMKKFIAQQDEMLQDSSDKQHSQTLRALGGPRPLPPSGSRSRQLNMEDEEDLQSKRKNIFKRALKGLSLKSGNDLAKIEGMLEQLLDEVEALREGQGFTSPRNGTRGASVDPIEHDTNDAPLGSRSPYLGSPRPATAEKRVDTVPEEDDDDMEIDEDDPYVTAHLPIQEPARHERAGSMPLATPPRKPVATGARSTETTPKNSAEKARKHKSSSSSIFPKFSRWSKTTASSMGDNIRNSIQPNRKERPYSEVSRSGSDLAQDTYKTGNYYDPEGDDRIRSTYALEQGQEENRPPSPLVPSQVSEAPKYRAHRGSLDLQHPQPRQGPTGRYQNQLESQAQSYTTPTSPNSEQWGSNPSLPPVNPNQNRFSAGSRLSPISDAGYSETSSRTPGPPRPPKVKDTGPLVPERPPKVPEEEDEAQAQSSSGDRVASRSSAIRSPPTRKPTGPRPLTSGGAYSPSNIQRTRYRGSPMQIDYDDNY
ncbi:uncharacterized protein N7496_002495 [Penicillium cataractarum]|uniref:Uncharacterized protein n=1 Tax=Penicillium cataractarum TaxID=2100454 RepID=A0A9W9VFJ4_9EURO|nr:uncharacterized protein N7496_002495 [Penicillium cataractarum]KAJ5380067.1 hypothetical protein N7496_002495 [Penicillium cataractarum]